MADSERAPKFAPFLGMAGAGFAMIFGCMGAAYGTFRSGAAVAAVGAERPDLVMKVRVLIAALASQTPWATTDALPVTPPDSHGGYHLGICARGVFTHSRGHESTAKATLLFVQWKHALSGWDLSGHDGAGCWIRDWCHRGIWDTRIREAVTDIRALGFAIDFCRGSGALWSFFGAMGCAAAIVFTCFGASYGMAKSSIGIMASSILRPDLIVRNLMPPILAGILSIYGLVVAVIISGDLKERLPIYSAFLQLGAGISVGLCGLAAGFAIGIIGDGGVRGVAQQPKLFVAMILILIFAEVLGLYGMIVALMLVTQKIILNQIPQPVINPTITTIPIPHLPTSIPAAAPPPGSAATNPVWLGIVVATPAPAAVHVAAVPGHASPLSDEQIFVALSIPTLTPAPPATVI
ncbi:hypothetical protein V502_08285, partial [Pseudogymnoascus sp. VKM F-4520 (FW-2644)]